MEYESLEVVGVNGGCIVHKTEHRPKLDVRVLLGYS